MKSCAHFLFPDFLEVELVKGHELTCCSLKVLPHGFSAETQT